MYYVADPRRDRVLARLVSEGRVEPVSRGDMLWVGGPGPAAARCVFLIEGLVVVRTAPGGAAVALAGPSHLVGLEALSGAAYRTEAEALTPARVVRLEGPTVLRRITRTTHTLRGVVDALHREATRLAEVGARAGGPDAATRLARVVVALAQRLADARGCLPAAVTHQLLADLAGLHRSTVTTTLNDWIYRGLLGQEGRRLRVDPMRPPS